MGHSRFHYAVVGQPVKHSKSPLIHSLFAKQCGIDLVYEAMEVTEDNFDTFIESFFAETGAGLNITVPYKEKAFALASSCSPRANLAKAVNTLFLDDENLICGENTDGPGLITDIKSNHGFALENSRILILGAGGAVRGVLAALISEQLTSITIANRTLSRAETLRTEFEPFTEINVETYESIGSSQFDLIINGTSLGLTGDVPPIEADLMSDNCCCYDMMYGDSDTAFVRWAKQHGATLALDGLGMLVEQAAESFSLWHGIRPETASIISDLRNS